MGIKFCRDTTRPSLQVSEKEHPSLPQDCVFTESSFFHLQKRGERSSTQEDTTFREHWLCSPSCQTAAPAALWSPPGPHHCWLCHSSKPPLYTAKSLDIFVLKHHTSLWMTGRTTQGWLMMLCSQILISTWVVLPPSVVCRAGRGSQQLFLCLEPNKELTSPAECVLWSVGTSGGQSIPWSHEADWNTITQESRGSSPLRLPSHLCFSGTIITAGDSTLQLGWTRVQSYQGVSDVLG